MVGLAGGTNFIDKSTQNLLSLAALLKPAIKPISEIIKKQFTAVKSEEALLLENDTAITVGGTSANPLILSSVGGDRLVNLGLASSEGVKRTVIRKGNSSIVMNSGNSLLMTGGSSAINVGDIAKAKAGFFQASLSAELTSVNLDGNSSVSLLGSSSSIGTMAGGSAIALGGSAASTVTGQTKLLVNTITKAEGFEGVTVGAMGGGLAVSAFGGIGTSEIGKDTLVDVKSGVNLAVFGGGLAASVQFPKENVEGLIPDSYKDNIELNKDAFQKGGTATATSQNIQLNLAKNTSNALVFGGGFAAAYQYDDATEPTSATAKTGNVNILIGEEGAEPVFPSNGDKAKYLKGLKESITSLQALNKDNFKDKAEATAQHLITTLASEPGVNVGVLGGGMALAWSRNKVSGESTAVSAPNATATTGDVTIDVLSGYTVGIFGGGFAAASGDAAGSVAEKPKAELAKTEVRTLTVNFKGGETIGAMGGGIAVATGSGDMNFGTSAVANVGTVNLNVQGGSVDGIIGGGYSVDDTNPVVNNQPQATKNASSIVDTINITATSGKVGRLAFDVAFGNNQMPPFEKTQPGFRDYLDSMTYAMINGQAGIIGGGIASGLRNEAEPQGGSHVNTVNITIAGNTVVGADDDNYRANIYGGGLATEGALSTVGTVNIQIGDNSSEGPVINGDIYGGGIALDGMYRNAPYYNNAQSKVGSVNIVIASGTVNGDIYAGGRVISSEKDTNRNEASSIVETSHVTLLKDGVFKGKNIDAAGVVGDAILTLGAEEFDLSNVTVKGFNKVETSGHVDNLTFDFGEKNEATFAGVFDIAELKAQTPSKLTIADSGIVALTKVPAADIMFHAANGVLALGDKANAKSSAQKLSTFNAIPGLYLAGNVDLTNVNAVIGNAPEANVVTRAANEISGVVIGSNGSVMADAGADTAVTNGSISGTKTSGLYFINVAAASKDNKKVVFGSDSLNGFDLDNKITVDNVRYEAINNDNTFTFAHIKDESKLKDLGVDGFNPYAFDLIEFQNDEASKHIQSLLDQQNPMISSSAHRHAQLNAAFNLATAGGAQTAGIEGIMLGLEQVSKRAALTNTFVDGWTGFAEITGTQIELGSGSGMAETKTKLGGLAAGGEYTTNDWTFGGLLNLGTGNVKGHGNNAGVKNNVDFYGLQAYAAKRLGMFNLVGQAGWMLSKNDVKHYMGDSAKMDVNVFTVGGRGEMGLAVSDNVTVIPYVGMNYLRVHTDSYSTKKGFQVDKVNQNLGNLPIGVAVKGNIATTSGWQVKPVADVAYVRSFGDTNVKTETGVGAAKMATNLDVWSKNVGRGRVGLEVSKDNLSVGLSFGGARGNDNYKEVFGRVGVKYTF
ncbi:autotransporter family protein [Turicimonas muris]|uniref:autotransporter family protein n=2 Tax=Turicimonas muris TaxID=1796652 RepID=UPI00272D8555|nr:autotransporter outer membrane beta-barrel domain-containing protein [Turicimonas muris]